MSIQVTVPGKLILVGEYAVLEGADALVTSVDHYVNAKIYPSDKNYCQLSSNLSSDLIAFQINDAGDISPLGGQSDRLLSTMDFALTIIRQICSKIVSSGFLIKPFHLIIDTTQFYKDANKNKLGLGSSAAFTVALIAAISSFMSINRKLFSDKHELFRFACDVHFTAQGNKGSGVDIAASIFGGILQYNIASMTNEGDGNRIIPISILEDLLILPVWTGVSASTRELLLQLDTYRLNYDNDYQTMIERLCVLSEAGCFTYSKKKCSDFLDIVKDYYKVLEDFSKKSNIPIVSEIHERIARIVYSNGGVYKPSGAGGGDIGLAFSDSKATIAKVKNALMKDKIETLSIGISSEGVVVNN